ncbi:hypothetical protein RUND412_008210 [Rhizina undulata]
MLSTAHNVGEDWKNLESRCKKLETSFNAWKKRMQLSDSDVAASFAADRQKAISVVEILVKIVECFRKIGSLKSRYRGRSKDVPTTIDSSLFRVVAIAAAPAISIDSTSSTPLHFPSAKVIQALVQLGQKDETEVKKAIDQFHKDAREFQKAAPASIRNHAPCVFRGKARLTQVVDKLDEYTNALFEITKDMKPVSGPSISYTPAGALNTSFKEYTVHTKLPFRRNPNFSGRKDILNRICQILELDTQMDTPNVDADVQPDSKRKTVVLHGLGGMGKSQIALEYAHRFSRFYTAIFWIDADDIARTTDSACKILEQLVDHYKTKWQSCPDFQVIANILNIAGSIDPSGRLDKSATDAAMKTIHHWLSATENRGWLLLVDNHDKVKEDQLDDLIPACDWGSVIITTRLSNLTSFGKRVELEGIGAEDGLELILKSSGKQQQNLNESERGEAREIVKALGKLPLALDQAGAYILNLRISFSSYRERLQKGLTDLFNKKLPGRALSFAKASIRTTWELSFQELSEDTRHLLHICAFLSNEDIPEEIFRRGKSAVPWMEELVFCRKRLNNFTVNDENRLNDAIGNLFAFSLIRRKDSNSLWMHLLVQGWARERAGSPLRQYAEDAISLVASAINKDEDTRTADDWIFERRILSHLKVCLEYISEHFTVLDSIKVAEAASALGFAYEELAYYKQAEELCQIALTCYEKTFRKDHLSTLQSENNLGRIFYHLGRYDDALEKYEQVSVGRKKILGKNHISTLKTVQNIAVIFHYQGRYDEALELYQRALVGMEKTLGKDHPDTLNTLNNMASVFSNQGQYDEALEYYHQGQYDEALEYYQRALAGREKALGKDHPDTLNTVNNMARVFSHQGQYDEALKLHQQALVAREKTLGKDHSDTVKTVDNIAKILSNLGRYDEALELYRRVLAGNEKALGKDHPDTLNTLNNMASLFKQGLYDEALAYYQRALAGREKANGKDHADTLRTVNNMANLFGDQGRYDEVLECYPTALPKYEKTLDKDHPDTLRTVNNMANVFFNQGLYDEALEFYNRDLEVREKTLGMDHPDTLDTVNNMANILGNLGRFDEALELFHRALVGRDKALGKDHPDTLNTLNNMANVFGNQGQYDEALECYQRALVGMEKTLGKDHPDTLNTLNNMASVFFNQGQYDEALEYYQRALAGREKALGKDHPDTLNTVNNMARVFNHQGRYDEALEWHQRALVGRNKALGKDHPTTLNSVNNMVDILRI